MRYPQNDLVLQRPHWDYHGFRKGDIVVERDDRYNFKYTISGIGGGLQEDHIQLIDQHGELTPWEFARDYEKL